MNWPPNRTNTVAHGHHRRDVLYMCSTRFSGITLTFEHICQSSKKRFAVVPLHTHRDKVNPLGHDRHWFVSWMRLLPRCSTSASFPLGHDRHWSLSLMRLLPLASMSWSSHESLFHQRVFSLVLQRFLLHSLPHIVFGHGCACSFLFRKACIHRSRAFFLRALALTAVRFGLHP